MNEVEDIFLSLSHYIPFSVHLSISWGPYLFIWFIYLMILLLLIVLIDSTSALLEKIEEAFVYDDSLPLFLPQFVDFWVCFSVFSMLKMFRFAWSELFFYGIIGLCHTWKVLCSSKVISISQVLVFLLFHFLKVEVIDIVGI